MQQRTTTTTTTAATRIRRIFKATTAWTTQTALMVLLSLLGCACLVVPYCLPLHHLEAETNNLILTATTTTIANTNVALTMRRTTQVEKEASPSQALPVERTATTSSTTTTTTPKSAIRAAQLPEASQMPWKDMDLNINATCGVDKCFFRSISDATLGYLVAGSDRHDAMIMASKFAEKLQQEFGAKHFHRGLAYTVNVSEDFQQGLNNIVHQPNRNLPGWEPEDVFLTDEDLTYVVLQDVQVAPQPSLFLAVAAQNREVTLQQLDSFRRQIPDKQAFAQQYNAELKIIQKALRKYPKLHYDFQGMVDVHGNFYFIDLDGQSHQHKPLDKRRLRETRKVQMQKLMDTLNALTKED